MEKKPPHICERKGIQNYLVGNNRVRVCGDAIRPLRGGYGTALDVSAMHA
jgi:hypothetical protein